ncbi:MAG: hypothetical protein IKA36_01000 [Clostridia bacterium]|nr:hypothetical protein [Clostridia bacterium]
MPKNLQHILVRKFNNCTSLATLRFEEEATIETIEGQLCFQIYL